MNIEFVYLILIGINNFMEDMGNNDHESILSSRKRRKQEEKKISIQRLKDKTKITLETLKF